MSQQPLQIGRGRRARLWRAARVLCVVLAALLSIGLAGSDSTAGADEQLRVWRESLTPRDATGTVVIAEIDAKSIAALKNWPWPRQVHARLVDRLSEQGAKTIAFDVDFSAASNPADDLALAAALKRAGGGVILPTFRQRATGVAGGFIENIPIARLRDHSFLASVNVHPDGDGIMRTFSYGTVTQDVARPAMPAMLAGVSGRIGETFPVNTSIHPESLPRFSVTDILDGRTAPGALRGKTVLIGATAIELGDRYAMPRHGVRPGVVIQALAAETLLQGLVVPNYGATLPILLALAMLAAIARRKHHQAALGSAALAALLALPFAMETLRIGTVDVAAAAIGFGTGLAALLLAQAAARFEALRLIDAVSGLPNERALRQFLAECNGDFLIVMRIRNFDEIAELMSEEQRRALIEQVCTRIALAGDNPTIFSLGNGRLAWTAQGMDLTLLTETLDGLAALFSARIAVGAQRVIVSPAFGIAQGEHRRNPAHADLAASRAAAIGCRWFVYSDELAGSTGRAQQLLADLDEAMAARDIYMVFQPKLSLASGRIESVEALVRWNHAALGPIPPDQFIPVLEESGRMADLTLYIADRCAEVINRWHTLGLEVSVAVNISAPLFSDEGFVAALFARVNVLGALAGRLSLEITESAVVLDDKPMIAALKALRARGLTIAIDDYGTGQSTLSYLKKFPVDEIKIDQSFIRALTEQTSDQILVRSTIAMAHELGFKVIAEGVEDEASMAMLAQMGCDTIQGWHIGKGVRAEELEQRLRTDAAPGARASRAA